MVHEFTWILEMKLIAAPNSERTNLSPFTKGCREEGAFLRISKFFRGLSHRTECCWTVIVK